MRVVPIRLGPGTDLRLGLEQLLVDRDEQAGCVISGIGSLSTACLRLAGGLEPTRMSGEFEILSLAGTLALNGAHLHLSIADEQGLVIGGHLGVGSLVRTTAELVVGVLTDWSFRREIDPATGFRELQIRQRQGMDPVDLSNLPSSP